MRVINKKNDYPSFDVTLLSKTDKILLSRALGMYFEGHINRLQFIRCIDQWRLPIIK